MASSRAVSITPSNLCWWTFVCSFRMLFCSVGAKPTTVLQCHNMRTLMSHSGSCRSLFFVSPRSMQSPTHGWQQLDDIARSCCPSILFSQWSASPSMSTVWNGPRSGLRGEFQRPQRYFSHSSAISHVQNFHAVDEACLDPERIALSQGRFMTDGKSPQNSHKDPSSVPPIHTWPNFSSNLTLHVVASDWIFFEICVRFLGPAGPLSDNFA